MNRLGFRFAVAIVAIVVVAPVAPVAQAQNLLPNGSFSELFMLEGWPVLDDATWSSIDSYEVATSGSLRVSNATSNTSSGADSLCFPAEADTLYRIEASALWLDAESSTDGAVQVRLSFYTDPNCVDFGFAGGSGIQTIDADSWQRVQAEVLAPAGTDSALASLWNWRGDASGTFVSYFDEAEVVELPEPASSALAIAAFAALAVSPGTRRRLRRSARRPPRHA